MTKKRPINYTSRDFESIKNDLVNYAKRYYPTTFKDFSEASFGAMMMDLVAYVGDQLSFYSDFQANESYMDTAIRYENVLRLARIMGYRLPGSARSTGQVAFYISVPADSSLVVIDKNSALYLEEGDNIEAGAGAASDAVITINYEELS